MLQTSILLVEDNRDCETLAVRALKKAGFTTISVARDGAEAINVLLGETDRGWENPVAEVVLLDLRLPKLDGIDVLKRLRADQRTSKLPVFALSSSEDPTEIDGCVQLGVVAVLPKPLDAEFLKTFLDEKSGPPLPAVRTGSA
ncbi:response regulator [Geomonas sp. RF6]|uniref:response regulator n=1 Tax=Geomonas sp. RF6 TaxID=2897342 RepID=UPI001E5D4B3C|nr:response regulator [Geomonas sp. RF6]UFS72048.1 response regulator [Geomonas sp. RF6]